VTSGAGYGYDALDSAVADLELALQDDEDGVLDKADAVVKAFRRYTPYTEYDIVMGAG
jgi:Ser/Thr protein kinase RdoA (MazF antagonist)